VNSIKELEKPLHDKKGKLTLEGFRVLVESINNPTQHIVVDLGINKFKALLNTIPGITKAMKNDQIRQYKNKAWGEYTEIAKHSGSFPIHNTEYCS